MEFPFVQKTSLPVRFWGYVSNGVLVFLSSFFFFLNEGLRFFFLFLLLPNLRVGELRGQLAHSAG